MKHTLLRYLVYILILIAGIVILSVLRINNKIENAVFFGGIASLLTLFLSIINYYQNNDKFFKDLFKEFNDRYDRMNNFLNQVPGDAKLSADDRQMVIGYLNLCAEEYMWVKRGRIPVHIWESWQNGIVSHLRNPTIRAVFEEEKALWKSSYYGFFDNLKL